MNDLQIFSYADAVIRTTFSDEGEPIVCAADLARTVGLKSPKRAFARIDPDQRLLRSTHTPGGTQDMVYLTESGTYEFLMGLRLNTTSPHFERIKSFRKWVFGEVLPSIRRTGSYSASELPKPVRLEPFAGEIEASVRIAKAFGLEGNQAILSAAGRMKRRFNLDLLGEFQLSLPSPNQDVQRTVTQVAAAVTQRTGVKMTAVQANQRLAAASLQIKLPSGKHGDPRMRGRPRRSTDRLRQDTRRGQAGADVRLGG